MDKMGRTIESEPATRELNFSNAMIQKGSFNNVDFVNHVEKFRSLVTVSNSIVLPILTIFLLFIYCNNYRVKFKVLPK